MEFGNKENIIYIIIPILLFIIFLLGLRKRENILKNIGLFSKRGIEILKILLITCGGFLVFISLLSPQKLKEDEKIQVKGSNVYALIDISRSMLTKDVYPNRLEGAKRSLDEILDGLKGDRIGFIPFSDSAYVQMPLTDDYSMGKNYVNAIDSNLISGGGTKLLQGLELANKSFEESGVNHKIVIILTDGGDYDKNIIDYAKNNKLKIYVIGVGTENGGVIPGKVGFLKDKNGNTVISRLNDKFMKELANETGGKFYEVNNLTDGTKILLRDIKNLEGKNIREENLKVYKKYYQIPLGIGIILILCGYLLKRGIREEYNG